MNLLYKEQLIDIGVRPDQITVSTYTFRIVTNVKSDIQVVIRGFADAAEAGVDAVEQLIECGQIFEPVCR